MIGSRLSRQMSGKNAAKLWYNIRQQFGKERRKVVAALKGKSGQEAKSLHEPKWQFYNLCLFLIDHITPRKTASSYMSKKNMKKTIGQASLSPILILLSPLSSPSSLPPRVTLSSQVPSLQTLSPQAPSPSSIWSTSDVESIFSNDSASVFSSENKENEVFLKKSTPSPNNFNVEKCSSVSTEPSTKEVLNTIQKIPTITKRIIPESDNFSKCKKKDDNLFMQTITKQSKVLTSFATKLEESLSNSGECKILSSSSFVDDPVLGAIKYAFKSVPEEKHLECMVELLQIIKSKYAQQ